MGAMFAMHRFATLPLALCLATSGCFVTGSGHLVTTARVRAPAPPTFNPSVTASVTAPVGAVTLQAQCQPGTQEACNGLDDNCDGVIDEGCGYSGGNIQITAVWQTAADIDLHVTDPTGQELYYGNRAGASGGVLDHDANSACRVEPPTAENVYWNTQTPPRGTYVVRVEAYDLCGVPSTPTTLSIAVGGRVVGAYTLNFVQMRQSYTFQFVVP